MIIDAISIFLIAVMFVFSFMRGFIKELLGVLGVICSVSSTYIFYDILSSFFITYVGSLTLSNLFSGIVVFVSATIVTLLINQSVLSIVHNYRLSPIDRTAGLILGIVKSVIAVFFLFSVAHGYCLVTELPNSEDGITLEDLENIELPNWLSKSEVYPIYIAVKEHVDFMLPEELYIAIRKAETENMANTQ